MNLVVVLVMAYLAGSIPTGYWIGKSKGLDIRRHGSGNVGATNVFRVLGPRYGITTFFIDALKGGIPTFFCLDGTIKVQVARMATMMNCVSDGLHGCSDPLITLNPMTLGTLVGLAAIAGHCTSPFVGFKGGKGVATSAGVFAALSPLPFLIGISLFAVVAVTTRYVSLGSLVGALTLAVSSFMLSAPRPLAWSTVIAAVFVFWTHRANIQRLLKGTESKIQW